MPSLAEKKIGLMRHTPYLGGRIYKPLRGLSNARRNPEFSWLGNTWRLSVLCLLQWFKTGNVYIFTLLLEHCFIPNCV